MKVTPIHFSALMVRALLAGTKVQTRRIIKPQPQHIEWFEHQRDWCARVAENRYELQPCPYGKAGEALLWVRETIAYQWPEHCDDGLIYSANEGPSVYEYGRPVKKEECDIIYRATDNGETEWMGDDGEPRPPRWTPPIHMPRRASRLTLELTEVRAERLRDISEEDALAEGIAWSERTEGFSYDPADGGPGFHGSDPRESYFKLWDFLNGDGESWKSPWVWCLSFRIHQVNIDTFVKTREAAA